MQVIAHRGANREALENSWSAFERAIEGGARRIELDVLLSRDGAAVVNHDDSLARTTGVAARISQLDRADLARIKLINGEPLPFLDQVIERLLPRVELNIEIKQQRGDGDRGRALAAVVAASLARAPRREAAIISCFQEEPLVWLARHAPDLERACLWSYADTFAWPNFANLAPPVFLERCAARILHPYIGLVNENLMDQARARGWMVYAWAGMADEEHDRAGLWASLKTVGLDGLCTNYPRQLRTWLEEAEQDERTLRRHVHGVAHGG